MKIHRIHSAVLALIGLATCFISNARSESYTLSPLWSIAPEIPYEWVSTNHTHRGIAYNASTTHLLTVTRHPLTNAAVYILNSENGSVLGELNTNGIFSEINFPLNMISVAGDGAIYACNLTIDSTNLPTGNTGPFRIYRWANETAEPTLAYIGDPSNEDTNIANRRLGDSLAVRGSGTNTELLAGSRQANCVVRFTTTDGVNFTHQKISAPDLVARPNTMTIAFGAGNTFWIKTDTLAATNYPLQQFSFDPATATATLIRNYMDDAVLGGPLTFDSSRKLLAMVATKTHDVRLLKFTDFGFVQQAASAFSTTNANGNNTGSLAFGGDKLFALESNNGIMAFRLHTNGLSAFNLSASAQAGSMNLAWPSAAGFIYQPQYKENLGASWINLGSATNGTGQVISVTDLIGGSARFYRINAQ